MPLILDAATQNISTATGDTGTYTWDNIFALGSTKITKTGNVFFCTAQINLVTTSTLNINNHNIEISGTSFINGKINITNSRIIISAQYTQPTRYLTLGRLGTVTDSTIILRATDQFTGMGMDFNAFINSHIFGEDFGSAGSSVSRRVTLLSGNSSNVYIKKITEVVFSTTTSIATNLSLFDVNDGIVNFNTMQMINLFNYSTLGTTRLHYKIGQGSFRFINSPDVILSKGGILNPTAPDFNWGGATPIAFQSVAHYIKIADSIAGIVGAGINYSGYSNINLTSTTNGNVAEIILDIENTNSQSNIQSYNQNSSGSVPALVTVSTPNYTRTIKSYGHKESIETFVLTKSSSLGTSTSPATVFLLIDEGITQTNTVTVNGYTGITHTTSTITVTELRTLNEIYDSRKLYWRNTNNVNAPYLEGTILNLNGANLVVDGVNLVSSSKFKSITTTGTITYLNNGNTTFPTKDSNGFRFKIYGLPTKSNSFPVIRVKRISNNTITNPTITNGEVYIYLVEGEDYEIRADAIGFIASNFITVNTNISSELQITLEEILDADNNPVYGNGIQQQKDLITYNNSTNTISIAYDSNYPTISIFSAVDKLEEILATNTGLEIPQHPVYLNGKLVFIRNILTNAQSTIKIIPATGNTGDPELVFELVREGDEKPYNLFDFSTSNGRIIKYPTTVNTANINTSTIAASVWSNTTRTLTSSSSLTPEQEAKLNNLDVAVSTRLSSNSYIQAPTTAQIKTEIESSTILAKEVTTASRASQTSVNLIPTNTLLTTDNRLNNLDTTISSRLATSNYLAPTLTQIENSIILAKESTLNTKASQSSVNSIPTAIRTELTSELSKLDVNISTRLATSDYNSAPTVSDIRTELSTELNRIDTTVSSRATSANVWTNSNRSLTEGVIVTTNNDKTNYELSSNSISAIWNTLITSLNTIGSIGKRIVDFLDTSLSSRSSQTSVDTKPTLNDIESSTILAKQTTLLTIPTNPVLVTDTRLNTLDANISTRLASSSYVAPLTNTETITAVTNALNTKDVATTITLENTKTEIISAINLTGLTEEQNNKLNQISNDVLKLKKLRGLSGVSVIAKAPTNTEPGYLKTSDNDINLVLSKNGEEEILSDN